MDIMATILETINMTIYIQPNLTQFPTSSVLTGDAIRYMTWLGFSSETTAEQIVDAGYIAVTEPAGTQPDNTTLVVDKNHSGEYTASWILDTELQQIIDQRTTAGFVRMKRDMLLQQSDWTQGKDVPDSISSAWAPYRQALRDISSQQGFPNTVTWPTQPE